MNHAEMDATIPIAAIAIVGEVCRNKTDWLCLIIADLDSSEVQTLHRQSYRQVAEKLGHKPQIVIVVTSSLISIWRVDL